MDYFGTLKKAFFLTIKNKFLWIFGLFVGASGAGAYKFGSFPSSGFGETDASKLSSGQQEAINSAITNFVGNNIMWILFGMLIVLLLVIAGFILNIISQGALIRAVNKIDKREKVDFWLAFHAGAKDFWRVWATLILYSLMTLAGVALAFVPVGLMLIAGNIILAVVWGLLMGSVLVVFLILMCIISPYSLRVIVLEKLNIWESIRESLHFVRKNLASVVIMDLLIFAAGLVYGILLGVGLMLVGGILFAIGFAIWLASPAIGIFYAIIFGVGFLALIAILGSGFNAFNSSVLTLTYDSLKRRA